MGFPFNKKNAAGQPLFVRSDGATAFLPLLLLPDYQILLRELLLSLAFLMDANTGAGLARGPRNWWRPPPPQLSLISSMATPTSSPRPTLFLLLIPLLSLPPASLGVSKWQSDPSLGWRPRAAIHWVGAGPEPSFQTKTGWELPCKVGSLSPPPRVPSSQSPISSPGPVSFEDIRDLKTIHFVGSF